ncbi:TIGR00288 family NYN domain-containing protein [Methanothermobacter thermautotrophicus]|uniref:TIGR00288 family NYN domain-containing protein n=1 Tax=Methanothermobacter thermautotrophicus TaxID=145262 RepID=A0A842YMY4_METTF|nr:TIGR00288 family NYN domain-containing protein [Methanothermobacter thermautotrophicus]MBE2900318.1 TIGR00288 family NYN domain-containing protein [Methanothermobacter thermautotrophicus]MCQ8904510.1 TIGR00288 family NYN domain-containing protein [Methanothermobacter sp.]
MDNDNNFVIINNSRKDKKSLGLLVDGPNMLRKEFCSDLEFVKNLLFDRGNLKIGKVLLNQYASDKLIEAVVNQGFSPMIVAGDVDVQLAVEAFELIHNPNIDVVAIMTRNADFLPLINIAKENGKETLVIGAEPGFSVALQNSADDSIILGSEGV